MVPTQKETWLVELERGSSFLVYSWTHGLGVAQLPWVVK